MEINLISLRSALSKERSSYLDESSAKFFAYLEMDTGYFS